MAVDANPARLGWAEFGGDSGRGDREPMDDQLLAIESGEGAGPGLKAAPAIVKLMLRCGGKVHAAIFAVEQRREGGAFVILRLRLDVPLASPARVSRPAARRNGRADRNSSTAV
jgi:hypothetical protein